MSNESTTETLFFDRAGLDKHNVERLVDDTLAGADDGELFLEYTQSEGVSYDDGRLKSASYDTSQGFGLQRVYTEDGTLDETMAVSDGDVVLVPRGHHPCGAPYGFEMYYLNVMAGPLRKWRFQADPAVKWIMDRDA